MDIEDKHAAGDLAARARGLASSVGFLAFFGALWGSVGVGGMHGADKPWLSLGVILAAAALFGAGIFLRLRARRLQAEGGPTNEHTTSARTWRFRLVFAIEMGLILAAFLISRAAGRFDLFFPAMMFIVGIHFFPLAALFGVRKYYLAGALLCALSIFTVLLVPPRASLGGTRIAGWSVALGFGGALILWVIGTTQWIYGQALLAACTK